MALVPVSYPFDLISSGSMEYVLAHSAACTKEVFTYVWMVISLFPGFRDFFRGPGMLLGLQSTLGPQGLLRCLCGVCVLNEQRMW